MRPPVRIAQAAPMVLLHRIARRSVLALATLVVIASYAGNATPARAATLNWSPRTVIDNHPPFANSDPLSGISCPTAGLCVGVDTAGRATVSTDPTGAQQSLCTLCSWSSVDVDTTHSLLAVACPTASLCVAVDDAGNVATSTNPGDVHAQWTTTNVDGTTALNAVSCPSASMCAAVDDSGNVVVSGNPTGGAAAWSVAAVDGGGEFRGVSCPTPTFCAAVDTSGQVVTSTNPLGGAGGWAAPVSVDTSDALTAVACPATNLCVAVDLSGNVIAATDPTGGAGQWTLSGVDPSPLLAVSCPTTAACVATDVSGDDVTSTNPAGGSAAWSAPTDIEATTGVSAYAVSCPSTALCFAVSAAGDVSWSTDPLDASPTWRGPYNIAGTHVITGTSCPTLWLCVASSDSGNEVTSIGTPISPAALSGGWGAPTGSFGGGLNAIACSASTKLCLGVGGDTIGSSDAGGASTAHWFDFGQGSGWGQLQGVSCPSDHFCVAVDDQGQAMTLLDQSATGSQFPLITDGPPSQVDGDNIIHAVSCPSLTLCVAVDDGGHALISTNPNQNQWRVTSVNGGSALNGVSCPSTTLCVAAGDDGRLVALENPATNLTAIGGTYDSGHVLSAISCTPDLCVAVDDGGRTISSTNFGAALPAWTLSTADPGHALRSIACVAAGMCVAGDADGAVVGGALPPPSVTTSAPRTVTSNSADLTGT